MTYLENIVFGDYNYNRKNPINVNFAGYSREDITASVEDGYLHVVASNEEFGKSFYKCLLPRNCDEGKIKLSLKNGILKISFGELRPKKKLEIS